jgi:quinone-modifying oxidoreductase, subunit QmoC
MPEWHGWQKLKYEAELDPAFADQISAMPGGEKLANCIQCGTCSGMCPLSTYMDYTPRRIVAMVRAGFKGEVLSSYTSWLCASCYACTVECPKGIKITDIMYAIKRRAIQDKVYPKRFPIPVLAKEFFANVISNGRSTDMLVVMKLFLKTAPLAMMNQAAMGMKLFFQGRIGLKMESIRGKKELQTVLNALDKNSISANGKGSL